MVHLLTMKSLAKLTALNGWLAACLILAASLSSIAADSPVPAGQRVFFTGHSFHMFVPPMIAKLALAAGIKDHKLAGQQSIGGSRVIQHWALPDEKNLAKKALNGGQVDVFTMAPHLMIPDQGITNFVELGLQHNPAMRFVVQGSWYPWDVPDPAKKIKNNAERDAMKIEDLQAAVDGWRKQMEAQVDELNKQHGKRAVFLVPVGDAVVKLRAMVAAGTFPGVTRQSQLFRDPIGHGQGLVMLLAAYCDFAAIYGVNPQGLKYEERSVSPEQHAILQKIAWDTVASYPYAGIAAGK